MAKYPKERATALESQERVLEIQGFLLSGRTRTQILASCKKWRVSDRQVDNYIAAAWKVIKEINERQYEENLSIVSSHLWDIFAESRAIKDGHLSLKILTQIAKVQGLEKFNFNHHVFDERPLQGESDEALDNLIGEPVNESRQ